jgi:hypothetical protein
MWFPQDIFTYILEYNGVNDYFPKQLINFIRYSSADDLERILKSVLNIEYKFNHKQLSTERRKILLKMLFTKSHTQFVFTRIMTNYDLMKNIYSFHNYGFKIGDEILYVKGHHTTYCGIITRINHKSIKLKNYAYEVRSEPNWDGRIVNFRYWIKGTFDNKHVSITEKIENVYKNDRNDTTLNRENFTKIRQY